jgi:Holliday junction resolvase RusA-like endonuclease
VGQIAAPLFPEPISGPVKLTILAYFEPPASWSKKKRTFHLGRPHTQKPDLDNIAKGICDGLNRIAFSDDSQIAEIGVSKNWGESATTNVIVEQI